MFLCPIAKHSQKKKKKDQEEKKKNYRIKNQMFSENIVTNTPKKIKGLIRDITLADLSREPVRKCEPSADFASDVIVFLWLDSLSASLSSFPVYKTDRKIQSKR